jgi:hypothetical protein
MSGLVQVVVNLLGATLVVAAENLVGDEVADAEPLLITEPQHETANLTGHDVEREMGDGESSEDVFVFVEQFHGWQWGRIVRGGVGSVKPEARGG